MKTLKVLAGVLFAWMAAAAPCSAYRDPETDTFLTRDPAGFVDGPNLYAYVRQNPWTHWDPLGLWKVVPTWTIPHLPNDNWNFPKLWAGASSKDAQPPTTINNINAQNSRVAIPSSSANPDVDKNILPPIMGVTQQGRNEPGQRTTDGGSKADEKSFGDRRRANQDDQLTPPLPEPEIAPQPEGPLVGQYPDNGGFGVPKNQVGLPPFTSPPKDLVPRSPAPPPDSNWPTWRPGEAPVAMQPANPGLTNGQKAVIGGAAAVGTGYVIYRVVRMAPSVIFPPLWPSIPANAAVP